MASVSPPPQASWSSLPGDLLRKIVKHLDTRCCVDDVLRLRAVCNSWRSSIPSPPKTHQSINLPFPIEPNRDFNPNQHGHFLLTESTVYALEPPAEIVENKTRPWFIKVQGSSKSDNVSLKDPLSNSSPMNLATHLPKVLNLLDYKVVELGKGYELELELVEESETTSVKIKQVAVSSSLDKVGSGGFAVMALHSRGRLALWRLGDMEWTNVNDNRSRKRSRYDNIAFYNGKFFAVDCNGFTLTVDPVSLEISRVGPATPSGFETGVRTKFLVKSLGDLFMVDKHNISFKDVAFLSLSDHDEDDYDGDYFIMLRIYKFSEEARDWVEVEELKDRAFFSSDDNSFSVSAEDFTGCKRDCVYFSDDLFAEGNYHPGYGAGIFALEDCTSMRLSMFPEYSNIFLAATSLAKGKQSRVSAVMMVILFKSSFATMKIDGQDTSNNFPLISYS